jgi:four helix bundle protein
MISFRDFVNGVLACETHSQNSERKIMAQFHQLRVWHLANEIVTMTYRVLAEIRGEIALRDQMKRAAISIASNIAEGSERASDADTKKFYTYARASAGELNAQFHILRAIELVSPAVVDEMIDRLDHCGRMLSKLIRRVSAG